MAVGRRRPGRLGGPRLRRFGVAQGQGARRLRDQPVEDQRPHPAHAGRVPPRLPRAQAGQVRGAARVGARDLRGAAEREQGGRRGAIARLGGLRAQGPVPDPRRHQADPLRRQRDRRHGRGGLLREHPDGGPAPLRRLDGLPRRAGRPLPGRVHRPDRHRQRLEGGPRSSDAGHPVRRRGVRRAARRPAGHRAGEGPLRPVPAAVRARPRAGARDRHRQGQVGDRAPRRRAPDRFRAQLRLPGADDGHRPGRRPGSSSSTPSG